MDNTKEKALEKIKELWNSSDKSKKFVQHLITGFVKNKPEVLTEEGKRCAVTGLRLTTPEKVEEYKEKVKKTKEKIKNRMKKEGRNDTLGWEEKEIKRAEKAPVEVRNSSIGYTSKMSTKIIGRETLEALTEFAKTDEVVESFKPKKRTWYKGKNNSHPSLNVDDETMKKLKELKNKLGGK